MVTLKMSLKITVTFVILVAIVVLTDGRPRRPKSALTEMMSKNSLRHTGLLNRLQRSAGSQVKTCRNGKVYDAILQKCVKPSRGPGVISNGFGNGGFGGK